MDGSHNKESIPLEPEGSRRLNKQNAVQPGQSFFDDRG